MQKEFEGQVVQGMLPSRDPPPSVLQAEEATRALNGTHLEATEGSKAAATAMRSELAAGEATIKTMRATLEAAEATITRLQREYHVERKVLFPSQTLNPKP